MSTDTKERYDTMNLPATTLKRTDEKVSETTIAAEGYRPFRLSTALPVGVFRRDQVAKEGEYAALLREISARECRIETQKVLDIGCALAVRVGVNYLDCIVRNVELAPHGFTAELQILPTRNGVALLDAMRRLVNANAE